MMLLTELNELGIGPHLVILSTAGPSYKWGVLVSLELCSSYSGGFQKLWPGWGWEG